MIQTPHFVLDLEQLLAGVRIDDILETVLKVVRLFRNQTVFLQKLVRP